MLSVNKIKDNFCIHIFIIALVVFLAYQKDLFSQKKGFVLKGHVIDATTRKPVDAGSVTVLEAKVRVYTDSEGFYRVKIPEAGKYTVIVRSEGLQTQRLKLAIAGDTDQDFQLSLITTKGRAVVVTADRDVQKVSRYTMTVKELKEVPASFGDSISALTSLPGVIRTGDFFGPLVIRGGNFLGNNYFIDDIPISQPMHFGGIHSVINNNIMSEIDLYASAFPAQFGSATGAVISINTVDEVKEFGGYTDVGLISASMLLQTPIKRGTEGFPYPALPQDEPKSEKEEIAGYIIASGRIGYLTLFIPIFYEIVMGKKLMALPEYWDYQFKMKYSFNPRHSITFLFFGSKDYFKFLESGQLDESSDPLLQNFQAMIDRADNNMGLYYIWKPNDWFSNRLLAYAALIESYQYFNLPSEGVAPVWKDLRITSRPYIFGLKDKFKAEIVKKTLELRGGPEYAFYYFSAKGKTLLPNVMNKPFNPADPTLFSPITLDEKIENHVFGGYIEAKLTWGWLTFVSGVRSEYLTRSGETTLDPRGMMSLAFPTKTTLSMAMGKYSYFFQTNPNIFDQNPDVSKIGKKLVSEKAIHSVVGIEQGIALFSLKAEGFYNTFYDLAQAYPHFETDGSFLEGLSIGRLKAYGVEVMFRKDLHENDDGLYGWLSYTYTRSRFRSGLPTQDGYLGDPRNKYGDLYGDTWITSDSEQRHAFKLVAGMKFGRHTLSCKFQYYTAQPFTPITGSIYDVDYKNNYGKDRYVPVMGYPNSKNPPDNHRLDVRYTYKVNHSWGYVSWYFEVINIYYYNPPDHEQWDYRYPYSESGPNKNPRMEKEPTGIVLIPNFGVEVKF